MGSLVFGAALHVKTANYNRKGAKAPGMISEGEDAGK